MNRKLKNFGLIASGALAGVLISVAISAIAQREPRATLPLDDLRQFSDVFGAIKKNYVEPVEDRKLFTSAISGMLAGLDPHSSYLDADAFNDLQVGTQGEFGGLGIEVNSEDGFVKVVSPIEDTPAARAGIKSGDLIIKIDKESTKGMSLNDAVKRMRGKPKTQITLTVARKGETKPLVFVIVREVIRVQSVKSKMLDGGIGYLRVTQFQEHTAENVGKSLATMTQGGALKGLVLDLRNDPGGLLHSAIGVSAAFLPAGQVVVSTKGRTEDAKREYIASPEDYMRGTGDDFVRKLPASVLTVPMVVLVNAGSASASEIVAGALQDHKRAVLLGTQTFGKGSVQSILPLANNTAIKLTTARYYTPSGRSIQATGIVPDFVVEETANGDSPGFQLREADLGRHLLNDQERAAAAGAAASTSASVAPKTGDEPHGNDKAPRKPVTFGSADDYQLAQALNYLKGKPVAVAHPEPDPAAAAAPGTAAGAVTGAGATKPKK